MSIQIGQKPSPTFQQPLELLSDCHRRVERFLRDLILIAEQADGRELNHQQRDALETALRYFREAAPRHTADEEESLFPRMREHGGKAGQDALAKIEALENDHVAAKQDHDVVERLGQSWLQGSKLSSEDTLRLKNSLRRLDSIYARHIAVEDNEIFPAARTVLDASALEQVGREMAERRGQNFDLQLRSRF